MVGHKNGSSWGVDEYGRNPWHPNYEDPVRRQQEHRRFDEGKREWAKRRFSKSLARVVDQMHDNTVADLMMNNALRELNLLPPVSTTSS
jgi:hypothetical protein